MHVQLSPTEQLHVNRCGYSIVGDRDELNRWSNVNAWEYNCVLLRFQRQEYPAEHRQPMPHALHVCTCTCTRNAIR